jgi:uridine kinase
LVPLAEVNQEELVSFVDSQLSLSEIINRIQSGERRNTFTRIIAIDGPAGAGKTTLAERLSRNFPETPVVIIHMDDLYAGWNDALTPTLTKTLEQNIARPASLGKAIEYRKFDWLKNSYGEFVKLTLPSLLILEGVGSGQREIRKYLDQLIWIDIESEMGFNRVLQRDGDYLETEMRIWQMRESEHFKQDNTRDCATIRVDGKHFI